MNKAKLAQQIDHALKKSNLRKNVIKGMGWKGNGHRYYTGGFVLRSGIKCVMVIHSVPHELLSLKLSMVDDSELTEYGIAHKKMIQNKTRIAIDEYKAALSGFIFEEATNQYGLPYLIVKDWRRNHAVESSIQQ